MSNNTTFILLELMKTIFALALVFGPVYVAINYSYWFLLMWVFLYIFNWPKFSVKQKEEIK